MNCVYLNRLLYRPEYSCWAVMKCNSCQSKIAYFKLAISICKHIFWFQITVEDIGCPDPKINISQCSIVKHEQKKEVLNSVRHYQLLQVMQSNMPSNIHSLCTAYIQMTMWPKSQCRHACTYRKLNRIHISTSWNSIATHIGIMYAHHEKLQNISNYHLYEYISMPGEADKGRIDSAQGLNHRQP